MKYTGQFKNIKNDLITVNITIDNQDNTVKEITRENGLWFSADPIQIETNINDTFEHLIRKNCTINLITNGYVGTDLFADNARSVEVEILNGNVCFFHGYLEPNTFSQPFAKPLEEFSLNCVDSLSTLQYYKYNDTTLSNFDEKKASAKVVTFKEIFDKIFDETNGIGGVVYYDLSKGISINRTHYIFQDLAISEQYLIGEDYDDTWTYEEVLTEILQYLNLHIIQEGYNYYIFDWDSIKNKNTTWLNLNKNTLFVTESPREITLTNEMHGADDTNITIADVFNQISVKDNLEEMEDVIVSPLDSDSLYSLYGGKQLYMTEFISEGSGEEANQAMEDMINGVATTYKEAKEVDWYIQAMNSKNWNFYLPSGKTLVDTIAEQNGEKYINQWKIAKYVKEHALTPYIFKFGSVERKAKATDNSPTSKISMDNYLYISINGNEDDSENTHAPSNTLLESAQPLIEYIGNNSGGVFSPMDDDTTNYLVFSGEMLLQPIVYESSSTIASKTNNYQDIVDNGCRRSRGHTANVPHYDNIISGLENNLVKSDNNEEGRYYTRKFWTITNPTDTPSSYLNDGSSCVQPWTDDKSAHGYKYNYSAIGDGTDKFSKIPVLECELIIGNKRLIETNIDEYGNSTFEWVTVGSEPYEEYIDENGTTQTYQLKTFSLGFNPKIEDYIIGDEYAIQNTIHYTMNVDAEGTAIPIKKSDALSGAVIFRILGPINCIWNNITRRHPTWFRHTKWNETARFILSHTENIIIKDFECKIYSDNGLNEEVENNDLIYMSDETDRFVNKKDDIEFKFITQLSAKECLEKGINTSVNMNAVINATTNQPLNTIYNARTETTAKAEELYVDQYYREYSSPKILMTATMHNTNIDLFNLYISTVLNKKFFIQSMNFDVRMDNKEITFKEL